jgi:hypothetical protein
MAKIYETKDDYTKDVLKDQSRDMRLTASRQGERGLGWLGVSFILDLFNARSQNPKGWVRTVAGVTGLLGVIDVVRSFVTDHKVHNLELQKEQLGPQTVVLPPDTMPIPEENCDCKFQSKVGSTSLIEQAIKTSMAPERS